MSTKIGIVIDSTLVSYDDFVLNNSIEIIPLNVIVDGVSKLDKIEISMDDVLKGLIDGKNVSTSQPSPIIFSDAYTKLEESGCEHIIVLTISSKLSGTFNSAMLGIEIEKHKNIHVIDTKTSSIGAQNALRQIVSDISENKDIKTVVSNAKSVIERTETIFLVDDLKFLMRTGRISKTSATIGNVLKIKPILKLVNGEIQKIDKIRTMKKAIPTLVNHVIHLDEQYHIDIVNIQGVDTAREVEEVLKKTFPNVNIKNCPHMSPVVSAHLGIGGIGISYTKKA